MKNTYELQVRAQCPLNETDTDLYIFILECDEVVMVEQIVSFFKQHSGKEHIYQEDLTRLCAVTLGVRAKSIGWHSGVKVTCEAP